VSGVPQPLVALNADGIPAELRRLPQWVGWQVKPPPKPDAKFSKVPINPQTGKAASSTDPKTWATFPEALAAMARFKLAGIGFVFAGSGEFGVDLDKCRDPATGVIERWAMEIVQTLDTFTEISPSGTGLHLIGRGALPEGGRKKGAIEMYERGRFFTVTGVTLAGTRPEVAERSDAIAALHAEVFGTAKPTVGAPIGPGGDDDDKVIERASKGKSGAKFKALFAGDISGYASQSEADLALCSYLSAATNGDAFRIDRLFRRSALMRPKWDEQHGERTYGAMTIEKAIASHAVRSGAKAGAEVRFIGQFRPCTDSGNAERFVDQYGDDIRHVHPWKKWVVYRNGRWQIDDRGIAVARSKDIARLMLHEAAQCDNDKVRDAIQEWAKASEKKERRVAMVELARSEPRIPIVPIQFDRHPHLLNCANGTLDLETGALRPHDRADYLTKICPTKYVANASSPTWDRFLERVVPDDDERAYLLRFLGLCLSGDTSEQVLLIADGDGRNGKSTLFLAVQHVLSTDFAIQIPTDLLLTKDQERHPTEIADLAGVRLAIGSETPKNRGLDERLVKQLTGCDRIRARRMREDFWEFEPTHKLVLITNHLPSVNLNDFATVRRLHVVHFGVRIREDEQDRKLLGKLKREREGILARLIEGHRAWRERGLDPPESVLAFVKRATPHTKSPAEEFIAQCVVCKPGERLGATALYEAFGAWCTRHGRAQTTQKDFGKQLGHAGFGSKKSNGISVYLDIALSVSELPPAGMIGDDRDDLPVERLGSPREGVNGKTVPIIPDGPQDARASAVTSPPRVACFRCKTHRYWRARDGDTWRCGVCEPPSDDLADPFWSDFELPAAQAGNGTVFGPPEASVAPRVDSLFGAMADPEAH
jgi:putative DNA primase/helicase